MENRPAAMMQAALAGPARATAPIEKDRPSAMTALQNQGDVIVRLRDEILSLREKLSPLIAARPQTRGEGTMPGFPGESELTARINAHSVNLLELTDVVRSIRIDLEL